MRGHFRAAAVGAYVGTLLTAASAAFGQSNPNSAAAKEKSQSVSINIYLRKIPSADAANWRHIAALSQKQLSIREWAADEVQPTYELKQCSQ